jgi:hypothetical protein
MTIENFGVRVSKIDGRKSEKEGLAQKKDGRDNRIHY